MKKKSIKSKSGKKKPSKKSIKKSNSIFSRVNLAVFLFVVAIASLGVLFQGFATKANPAITYEYYRNKSLGISNVKIQSTPEVVKEKNYSYQFVSKSAAPSLNLGGKSTLTLKLRNTSNVSWSSNGDGTIYLGTSHEDDRDSVFFQNGAKGWAGANRIVMDKSVVKPGQVATFTFNITAPEKSGIYREFFKPLVDGLKWMDDKNIYWDVTVRDQEKKDEELPITVGGHPVKYIKVSLKDQKLYVYENGVPRYIFVTSTGIAGLDTPSGVFQIYNKYDVAYSKPYDLYMDNWMAFTASGEYGIHSLPYWLLRAGGRLYEGEEHLGTPVSHGCIRVSLENSKILYDWAEVGMQVIVVD